MCTTGVDYIEVLVYTYKKKVDWSFLRDGNNITT